MTALGGAYIALAEGTEGSAANSAAPAVRNAYSTTWFDYDLSAGISFPGAFTNTDFDNHGDNANLPPNHASAGNFTDLTVGGTLQLGGLGVSATGDLEQFSLTTTAGEPALTLQVGRFKALMSYGVYGGQIAIGGGVRVVTMQIQQNGAGTLLTMAGASPEVGALLMPTGLPWRIGATVRAPVSGGVGVGFLGQQIFPGSAAPSSSTNLVLPSQVVMPWEAEIGFALQLGPRPLNPGWENPHREEGPLRREIERDRGERRGRQAEELASLPPNERAARKVELMAEEKALRALEDEHLAEESARLNRARKARYANWPRERILLLASVLFTGQSPNAVSLEGFLDQRVETVGRELSVAPRVGLEAEPVLNHVVLRTGTYVEPSRYEGSAARQHFTFGGDIRLVPLNFWGLLPDDPWKLGLFVDLAPRYTNYGFGFGNWH